MMKQLFTLSSFLITCLLVFPSAGLATDHSRLWRARSMPDNWLAGLQPQADFLLSLMDRLNLQRLDIQSAHVYATGDQNLFMRALDTLSPLGMRTSPHFSGRADRVYLMYYLDRIPNSGSQADYGIALHELCHGLFDAYITQKLRQTNSALSVSQVERLHRKIAGFNEFFSDQCAIYQSGNPRIITAALRGLDRSTYFMSRLNTALNTLLRNQRTNGSSALNIRDSVGEYPDISDIENLASHFWFAKSRRVLWEKFSQIQEPTLADRQNVLIRLLSAGWRIFEFEATRPNSSSLRMNHLEYDNWLVEDMNHSSFIHLRQGSPRFIIKHLRHGIDR